MKKLLLLFLLFNAVLCAEHKTALNKIYGYSVWIKNSVLAIMGEKYVNDKKQSIKKFIENEIAIKEFNVYKISNNYNNERQLYDKK